jgi:glycosyltransferase involved in cell wall biosynthesis
MKIAHIFSYLGEGGTEDHAILLARKAKESGNDVLFVISDYSNFALKKLQDQNIKVIKLPMQSSFNPMAVLVSAIRLKRIITSEDIDVVHAHMLREQSIAIVAKMLGAGNVLIRSFHRFDQFNWKMRPLMPVYRRYTDAFISISLPMSDYLKRHGLTEKVHLIENGVEKVVVLGRGKALGFMGRLAKEKGILDFIKSNVDILRDTKLVIAGDGPDCENIKRVISDNNLKVQMLGKVSNKADFYKKVSVFVLPSSHEVLPLVVLESYSCGLPIVAFDLDLYKGLIDESNGFLIKPYDYEQMGIKALELLRKTDSYRKTNTTKYNQKYSADIMWAKTIEVYKTSLDERCNMLK